MYFFELLVLCLCCSWQGVTFGNNHVNRTIHVGALLPLARNNRFFVPDAAEVCQLAIDHINANTEILPDYRLVLTVNDSQCDIGLASYQMHRLLGPIANTKVAFIAEGCSVVTQPLAAASHYWNIPQLNFLSTSPALLDRSVYKHYYRLRPSENNYNPARAAIMESLSWKKSVVLIEAFEIFNLNSKNLIDVFKLFGLDEPLILLLSGDDDQSVVIQRIKESDRRILFGLFYEASGRQMICQAYKAGISAPKYVWMFVGWYRTRDWYIHPVDKEVSFCNKDEMSKAVNGHFIFDQAEISHDLDQRLSTGLIARDVINEYRQRVGTPRETPILETFRQHIAYGYDAITATALMLDNASRQLEDSEKVLGNLSYADEGIFKIFRDFLDTSSLWGLSGYVSFPELLNVGNSVMESNGILEIYYHRDNSSKLVARYDNPTQKLEWITNQIEWTTTDGEQPVDFPVVILKYSDEGIFVAVAVLASLGIVFSLVVLLFTMGLRGHKVFKASAHRLNNLIILGALCVYISIILFGFDGQFFVFNGSSIGCCYARNVLLSCGFTLSFGSIFARSCELAASRRMRIAMSDTVLFTIIALLLLIDLILLTLWYTLDPWMKGKHILETSGQVVYQRELCTSQPFWGYSLMVYKLFLLLLSSALVLVQERGETVETKGSSGPMNDSRHITISVYNTFVLSIATFAFTFISNPGVQYILVALTVIAAATVVVCLMFLPKIYWVLGKKRKEGVVNQVEIANQ